LRFGKCGGIFYSFSLFEIKNELINALKCELSAKHGPGDSAGI
jgi:hypothetical protein